MMGMDIVENKDNKKDKMIITIIIMMLIMILIMIFVVMTIENIFIFNLNWLYITIKCINIDKIFTLLRTLIFNDINTKIRVLRMLR